jgi:LasA protease
MATMPTSSWRAGAALLLIAFGLLACLAGNPPVIYITATPPLPIAEVAVEAMPNPFVRTATPNYPTAIPIRPTNDPAMSRLEGTIEHSIALGDTLGGLAYSYGTDLARLLALNPGLNENTSLQPGQKIFVPNLPSQTTPAFKLIPDSELVHSAGSRGFDVDNYIRYQPGFIRVYSEKVNDRWMSGADIINFFARSASVNPRLILALLEYRGGWITNPVPNDDAETYPMGLRDEQFKGLFTQVAWAVNRLNEGYYGWRTRGLRAINFPDNTRLAFAPQLNGGTVGVQFMLARSAPDKIRWEYDVSEAGFFNTYLALFGDPFRYAIEPLIPPGLQQPALNFPFPQGETWFLTSGPHGGWDARFSGWAAIDFAPPRPPDELLAAQGSCYISPNWATAVAGGTIVRSSDGAVVIDLDYDGDERTGWVVQYLHIADTERVQVGQTVNAGDRIGHPSCEGFYLNSLGTHIHVSRRYNGEWMVADCNNCQPNGLAIPFVLSGWEVKGYTDQVYQGWLQKEGQIRKAEQGRDDPTNQIYW